MRVGAIVGVLLLSACGLSVRGTAPPEETQSVPDASSTFESGAPDASKCRPITTTTPGSLVAPRTAIAPIIDGDLSDWDTCFIPLDRNNAYATRDLAGVGAFVSGEFSIMHDGAKVFVGVRMKGIAPLGDNPGPSLFTNDSAELYFDADGTTEQAYGADTLQIVVDHAGRHQGFRMTGPVDSPTALSAAKVASDGISMSIELEVSPETFGQTAFANPFKFDVALTNGNGTNQLTQIIWYQQCRKSSGCGCADGNDAPYCDARQFGTVMLAP